MRFRVMIEPDDWNAVLDRMIWWKIVGTGFPVEADIRLTGSAGPPPICDDL